MIPSKRLLYLSPHHLSAWLWDKGHLSGEGIFVATDESLAEFAAYLHSHRDSHFRLLANVAEEGFQIESIPYLRGNDRQALIRRRLGQFFFNTPLSVATSLGFEKQKRKNENLLLSALTEPAHFQPWLDALARAEAPLGGIYSLPQLSDQLLARVPERAPRCLLLTVQDHSIRESFIVDGKAHFSRMAPLSDSSLNGIASGLAMEASKLHQYLLGQRLVGRGETISVYVVAHPQAMEALTGACINSAALAFHFLDSHQLADKAGLHTFPPDSRSELLFLHLLATAPPRQQFAPEPLRHDFRILQIKQILLSTGLVALAAGFLFAVKQQVEHFFLQSETSELVVRENDLNRRYLEIAGTFPKLEISHESLRSLMEKQKTLQSYPGSPEPAYRLLSQALNRSPEITIDSLEWQLSASETGGGISGKSFPNYQEEQLAVRGNILLGGNRSPRQIVAALERFTQHLSSDPLVKVKVVQQPFDVQSGSSLKGGGEESDPDKAHAFSLLISRRWQP